VNLAQLYGTVYSDIFTDAQRQAVRQGANVSDILASLSAHQQQAIIEQGKRALSDLDAGQAADLNFLGSYVFGGVDLDTRLAILARLRQNDGILSASDLSGLIEDDGFNDLDGFASWLTQEYDFTRKGSSVAAVNEVMQKQQTAELIGLLAFAGGLLTEELMTGSFRSSGGTNNKDIKPPGWDENWQWKHPETNDPNAKPRWYDPSGGEWRWHSPDKWHPDGHWDYNPWDNWNARWQNIYPD